MTATEAAAARAWREQPGQAVPKGRGILLSIHPGKDGRSFGPSFIHFRPVRRGRGEEARECLKAVAVWHGGHEEPACAADIAWIAGRSWFDAGTTHTRRRVLEWLHGRCERCGCASSPSLLGSLPGSLLGSLTGSPSERPAANTDVEHGT